MVDIDFNEKKTKEASSVLRLLKCPFSWTQSEAVPLVIKFHLLYKAI